LLHSHDRHASSCLVAAPAFKIISLPERYSRVFVVVFKIISVSGRPTSSCFVAGFQVISVAGRFTASYFQFVTVPLFNIISVADHLAPSCCFVEFNIF